MASELHDLVVVVPGIMGSVLEDREGKPVWELSKGAIARGVLTGARAIKHLRLPPGIGDEAAPDGVRATALMPDLHVLPGIWSVNIGYEALVSWLRSTFSLRDGSDGRPANLVHFPYDWRLSNRYNAAELRRTVEPALERLRAVPGHEQAELVFITHSMGGLVARYYTDVLGGHEVTAKVITLGTPHRGALNALESLVNGVRKGFGPIGIDLTEMARSFPSLYQLLPEYACIEVGGELRKTTETAIPDVDAVAVADAMQFHAQLESGAAQHAGGYHAYPVLARTQPTSTSARIEHGQVVPLRTLDGEDQLGDGTVPRLSAAPYGVASDSPVLRYVMEKHGALPMNPAVLVECEGVLTGSGIIPRAADVEIGVSAPDLLLAGEDLEVSAECEPDVALDAQLADAATGARVASVRLAPSSDAAAGAQGEASYGGAFAGLAPGAFILRVGLSGGSPGDSVTTPVVVLDPVHLTAER